MCILLTQNRLLHFCLVAYEYICAVVSINPPPPPVNGSVIVVYKSKATNAASKHL